MRKLPVFASVREVFSGVTRHYFELLFAAWPAVMLILAAFAVTFWQKSASGYYEALVGGLMAPSDAGPLGAAKAEAYSGYGGVISYSMSLLIVLASAVAAVRWHRLVLLGEGTSGNRDDIRPIRSEDGAYIWTSIKLFCFYILAFIAFAIVVLIPTLLLGEKAASGPLHSIGVAVAVLGFLGVVSVVLRMSLALPDAALGGQGQIFAAFEAARGNGLRLLTVTILLLLPAVVVPFLLSFFLGVVVGQTGLTANYLASIGLGLGAIVYVAAYLYFMMAQITMLSVAYREIIGLPSTGETIPASGAL